MVKRLSTILFFWSCLWPNILPGQGDFFWSQSDFQNGATNMDLDLTFRVGESSTLFLYYSTGNANLESGAFLDIGLLNSDVIEFTAAETFEFDITVGDIPISVRWGDSFGSGVIDDDGQGFSMNAVSVVAGTGILNSQGPESTVFYDQGYDPSATAFLFGKVEFTVVGEGSTQFEQIVSDPCSIHMNCLDSVLADVSITSVSVPEPTISFSLIVITLIPMLRHRR